MSEEVEDVEQALADDIADFQYDPLGYAGYAYEWGDGDLKGAAGPRKWQAEVLAVIRDHLADEATRHTPLQIAVASGHGIGKSAVVAMVTDWAMSCWIDARLVITANTAGQLATKTQPEVAKWTRRAINSHWFDIQATRLKVRDPGHVETWRTDFIPWAENNTEAFAGLHNEGKIIVVVFDESSSIADIIWEVTEGALTDENTVIIWLAFGNPTRNTGRFRECFGRFAHRWRTFHIDSRTVEGTNKEQLNKWIEDYGEDSDFARTRVRGEFPRSGSSQFIPSDAVAAARKHKAQGYEGLPKILSCDVARFGNDQTVIGWRQGRKFVIVERLRGKSTTFTAERVMHWQRQIQPDAVVVDGDGLGAGTVDHIKFCGFTKGLFEFHGGSSANDADKYYNRRAEVWGEMRDWLCAGAEIPDDPELEQDLVGPEFDYAKGKRSSGALFLESKDDMVARGLSSPDAADCLAMTFAVRVAPKPAQPQPGPYNLGSLEGGWMR